jgi:Big-like domain-containing protein
MRRMITVAIAFIVACSAPTPPDKTPPTHIRVSPHNSTIVVGQSVPLNAATIDTLGDSIGVATVTWVSSKPSVASVSDAGVATGVAAGVAVVVATTSRGARDSATIIVNAGGCANVLRSPQLHGRVDFSYVYTKTFDSVTYDMHDNTATDFVVDSAGPDGSGHRLWMGADTGLAEVHDTRTDLRTGQVQKIDGSGHLVVDGINLSHVVVSVDTATCNYTLEAVPYVTITQTPSGLNAPGWFGWIRTLPTPIDTAIPTDTSELPLDTGTVQTKLAVHSATWLGANYFGTSGWYVPLGFSADYFDAGAPDDGSAGDASVRYFVRRGTGP